MLESGKMSRTPINMQIDCFHLNYSKEGSPRVSWTSLANIEKREIQYVLALRAKFQVFGQLKQENNPDSSCITGLSFVMSFMMSCCSYLVTITL